MELTSSPSRLWTRTLFGAAERTVPVEDAAAERLHAVRVHAYFGPTHAVRGMSLSIKSNRITAIIGPSGCGCNWSS